MRRKSTTSALSPKLLKHFAAVTVVMTALLTVFASGEDWGARAQISAVEAKNQLAASEAEKLGTKRIATTLKVANNVGAASFGDDEGGSFGDGGSGGGGGGGYASPAPPQPVLNPARPGMRKPNSPRSTNPLDPTKPPQPPGSEQKPVQTQPSARPAPTAQDFAKITASSARRSGSSGDGD